jgi:imidazolonepropionase
VEIKTGCGPDESAELKALRVIAALQNGPIDIVPTFLLRVPHGCSDDDAAQIVNELTPRIQRRRLAEFVDLWWDDTISRHDLYGRYLESAAVFGMGRKVHVEGPGCAGGLALAIGWRAASVDHLEHITEDNLRLLSGSHTVATLLPAIVLDGVTPPPPARALIDSGSPVAIASNFNPHRTPTWNMQTVIAMACRDLRMTVAEAISGATINGAHALGRGDRIGSLEPGKAADIILLNTDDYRDLGRYFGVSLVHMTIKRGQVIYREGELRGQGHAPTPG